MSRNCFDLRRALLSPVLALAVACVAPDAPEPSAPAPSDTPIVADVVVTSATDTLEVGQTGRLRAVPVDAEGMAIEGRTVIWSASVQTFATLAPDGSLVGLAPGAFLATATSDGRSTSLIVTVRAPLAAQAHAVDLLPRVVVLAPGASHPLGAVARDASGNPLAGAAVRFESSDPSVATVDASGRVVGVAPGSARIAAVVGGARSETLVRIDAAPPGAFTIDVRAIGEAGPLGDELRRAATRWEGAVRGDLSDVALSLPAALCGIGFPALVETVDDLMVLVRVDTLDGPGGTIASASPCVARQGSRLPAVGVVRLDVEDLAEIRSLGLLESVVAHEIGHVLGIGTSWRDPALGLLAEGGEQGPAYVGARVREAAAWLGFTGTEGTPVPLENGGGAGTRGLHWRESVFAHELMTGWIETETPLSALSVAALADLGYEVREAGADPFANWLAAGRGATGLGTLFGLERPPTRLIDDVAATPAIYVP